MVDKLYLVCYASSMGLNIKNPEVERLVSEIAQLTGETKTEALRRALLLRRSTLELERSGQDRNRRMQFFLEEFWGTLPAEEKGRRLSREEEDAILGYGPHGV